MASCRPSVQKNQRSDGCVLSAGADRKPPQDVDTSRRLLAGKDYAAFIGALATPRHSFVFHLIPIVPGMFSFTGRTNGTSSPSPGCFDRAALAGRSRWKTLSVRKPSPRHAAGADLSCFCGRMLK